ncbi:MAG TPA: efflux RND transporter periplasmic adaptor subunit [Polyangia bacterium]|nr:efflux RND transporter periplasmic adaptor subunit [Polyangia bacterium]
MATEEDRLADELASLRLDRSTTRRAPVRMRAVADTNISNLNPDRGDRVENQRRRGFPTTFVAILALIVLGVGGFFVYREGSGRFLSTDVDVGAVTLMSPAQSDVTLVATGYVFARKKATVAPKTTGRLAKLYVDEGAVVKEGQLIGELESADAQAALAQTRADIAAARAKVTRAGSDVSDAQTHSKRADDLYARQAGTRADADDARARLDAAKTTLAAAQADVRAVEARLESMNVALENTKVRAPFAGTVIRKLTEIGEFIPPTSPGVVQLASLDDLEVQADVAEAQFHKVKVGTPAEIILDAFPDKRFRGRVTDLRPMVDRSKASVTVKVRFVDPSEGVLPDMAAKVSFLTKALDDAALQAAPKLIVPSDAVVERNGQRVVFAVEEDHAHALPVTVKGAFGAPGSGELELADGPPTGTRVIRHPDESIRDGVSVKENKK